MVRKEKPPSPLHTDTHTSDTLNRTRPQLRPCLFLHLNLRTQFDHSVQRQVEIFKVAVGVLQQKSEQAFSPTSHTDPLGRDNGLAAKDVGRTHRTEVQLTQMTNTQGCGYVRLLDKAKVETDSEEPFAVSFNLKPSTLGAKVTIVLLPQEWLAGALPQTQSVKDAALYYFLPHCTEKTNEPNSIGLWQQVYERMGLNLQVQASGCCGMSGTYGHETKNAGTSEVIYKQSWAPLVPLAGYWLTDILAEAK